MTYVPIKIYPTKQGLRRGLILAAVCLVLAYTGFFLFSEPNLKVSVLSFFMVGFAVSMLNAIAVMRQQPMVKILGDRFSVYTPFGYASIRFGEVLQFSKRRGLFSENLCIEINKAAKVRFQSGLGRILYRVVYFKPSSRISLAGGMLGADVESTIGTLEKRRQAAIQPEESSDYRAASLSMAG